MRVALGSLPADAKQRAAVRASQQAVSQKRRGGSGGAGAGENAAQCGAHEGMLTSPRNLRGHDICCILATMKSNLTCIACWMSCLVSGAAAELSPQPTSRSQRRASKRPIQQVQVTHLRICDAAACFVCFTTSK